MALSRQSLMRLRETNRRTLNAYRFPAAQDVGSGVRPQGSVVQYVQLSSTTATYTLTSGTKLYPGKLLLYDWTADAWTETCNCLVLESSGQTANLSTSPRYEAKGLGAYTDGTPIYGVSAEASAGSGFLNARSGGVSIGGTITNVLTTFGTITLPTLGGAFTNKSLWRLICEGVVKAKSTGFVTIPTVYGKFTATSGSVNDPANQGPQYDLLYVSDSSHEYCNRFHFETLWAPSADAASASVQFTYGSGSWSYIAIGSAGLTVAPPAQGGYFAYEYVGETP